MRAKHLVVLTAVGLVASGLLLTASCKKDEPGATATAVTSTVKPTSRVDSEHFTLTFAPSGDCKPGSECLATVDLSSQAGYHINKEYPYRFTGEPASGVEFLGKDPAGPQVFTKAAGDYDAPTETKATMKVRFRAKDAGKTNLVGTYKFSVCSEKNCQIEKADLITSIDVK